MWNDIAELSEKKLDLSYLKQIERKKKLIHDAYDQDSIDRYIEHSDVKHISSSLKIEGTQISDDDTRDIYEQIMPKGIEFKTFLECHNLCTAAKMMKSQALSGIPLTYNGLMSLHLAIASNLLSQQNSGRIRSRMVQIGRGNYEVAAINQIDKLLHRLFDRCMKIEHPVVRAAFFSYNLVSIHPFVDFNGRTSRLCESYILVEAGYLPVDLKESEIRTYMELIRDGQEKGDRVNYEYIQFFSDLVCRKLDEVLDLLEIDYEERTERQIQNLSVF